MFVYDFCAFITQPEQNDAGPLFPADRQEIAEVQIHSQNNAPFCISFCHDCFIAGTLQALLTHMNRIMPLLMQPCYSPSRDAHIGEESHPAFSESWGNIC